MGAGKSSFIKENKLEDFTVSSDELRIKMAVFNNRRWGCESRGNKVWNIWWCYL